MFVAIENKGMDIFKVDGWINLARDENNGVIKGSREHDCDQKQRQNTDGPFDALFSFAQMLLSVVLFHISISLSTIYFNSAGISPFLSSTDVAGILILRQDAPSNLLSAASAL